MKDSLVIIPTYNECENVRAVTEAVLALPEGFDVLIIDDNSPDGTASIVKTMQEEPDKAGRLHLMEREGKLGLGTAYIAGFRWSLEKGYEFTIEMDADFSHAPADLPRLREACVKEGADVAIGSRYLTGVNVVNWPMGRVLMSYYASRYVRIVTGMAVNDATAGFVCWRRRVLEALPLDSIKFKGYAFQIEMKFLAYKYGFKVVEVPIVFVNRVLGTSKMSSGIFSEGLFGVLRLKWNSLWKKYPDYSRS
ncbi:MAG: polyprenol monophosphomannose synthase [Duncaniella sp.]|nr:polyprenol monophosphomannose synthase [Duncaniella sp.]